MSAFKAIRQVRWSYLRRSVSVDCAPWARNTVRYALALVLTGLAMLVRFHLDRAFHDSDAYVLFLLAAIAANWFCGLGPCLLTLLLGALAGTWFFALPRGTLALTGANQWFDLVTYLIAGLVIAWYGWARHKAEDELQAEMAQRERAEEALRQAHALLEERVQERTLELAQSFQGMRDLTYSIAHNLFAPLRAAHGFAELLLARCAQQLPEQGREYAGHIIEASARMGNLLEAVLLYGRVTSMEAPLDKVNTEEVVEQALWRLRSVFGSAAAKVEVQRPLPPVFAHPDLLTEAFLPLLHNAIEYVPAGVRPRVLIRAEPCAEGVCLQVQDNGSGIAAQYHKEIFGAFNRLVPDNSPSTGMGLTIAQKAVERMHGTIGLKSEPGRGSTFWLKLPRAA